nr:collagen alpha-1(I) chain-like isoform X2 [Pan paniscus]
MSRPGLRGLRGSAGAVPSAPAQCARPRPPGVPQSAEGCPGLGSRGAAGIPRSEGAAPPRGAVRGAGGAGGRRGRRGRAALGVCAGSCPARPAATAPVQSDAASAQLICIRGPRTAPPRLPRPSRPPPGTAPRACPAPPPRPPPGTPGQQVRGAGDGGRGARGSLGQGHAGAGSGGGAGADPSSPGPARRPGPPTASKVRIDPKLDPRAAGPPGMPGQGGVAGREWGRGRPGQDPGQGHSGSLLPTPPQAELPASLPLPRPGLRTGEAESRDMGGGGAWDAAGPPGTAGGPGATRREKAPSLSQARRDRTHSWCSVNICGMSE